MNLICGCILVTTLISNIGYAQWKDLLDKDHSQWETYLSYRHSESYHGEIPVDENGKDIKPIGYNRDSSQVFTVLMDKDEPILRVSGEVYGCIFTKAEYQDYHLKLKVKWGNRKYVPRTAKLRDSGILYHSIGESGVDYWRAWMLSQEFQIMEGHMGDYWNISTSVIDIRAFLHEGQMNSVASETQSFLPFGSSRNVQGYCMRSADYESPFGEWTTLELICVGDKSLHIVNGHVVMVLKNSAYTKDGKTIPLAKGKIQLQSDGAEVFFKDIRIKPVSTVPPEYNKLF